MVRHGKDKKRRAGRYGKVKLKNHNFKRWNPKPKIGDKTMKKLWDPSKTPSANLANLGLASDVNFTKEQLQKKKQQHQGNADTSEAEIPVTKVIELFDIPQSHNLKPTSRQLYKQNFPMTLKDQNYIIPCLQKHGDNYLAMFRDTNGTNPQQHTQNYLKKLGTRFFALTPSQRKKDIPDKVQQLIMQKNNHEKDDDENDNDSTSNKQSQ